MMKANLNYILFLMFIFSGILFPQNIHAQDNASRYVESSVLSEGKWVKIRVKENAVYKLTYSDIKKMGFSNPAKIKIYGYGGWILNQDFTKKYIDDLPEVAVWKSSGSEDLKSGDYLLFYGRGSVKWDYTTVSGTQVFNHENNPYDTYGYYFIKEDEAGPKTMDLQESYSQAVTEVTVFDDYLVHERDSIAFLNSGRELFGESFGISKSQNFNFKIPGITNDDGAVYLSFAAASSKEETAALSINNENISQATIKQMSGSYQKASLGESCQTWTGDKSESVKVNVTYNGTAGSAHLNFFVLNFKRKLQFYSQGAVPFRHRNSRTQSLKYVIGNANSNCYVWNITDPTDIKMMETTLSGTQLSFGAKSGSGTIPEYVMVDITKSFSSPEFVEEIKNQDLHAIEQIDMIIISPGTYTPYAEMLAEKHREKQGLKVKVVEPEWVYNEFSSGARDATAYRRFMKMFYDRAKTETEKPKYLLLYGDGFFDNRHLTAVGKKIDSRYYLLTYQFKESLNESSSYGTDDYFGFLDDSEGDALSSDKLDLGIGRFPVNTVEQAKNAVEKVIAYMDDINYGKWRNSLIFTADDTGTDSFCLHGGQADQLAVYMEKNRPEYIVAKSYMDAFQPTILNGKTTYPDAKNKLMQTLKDGCLLVNYTGHGSQSSLSAEDMMNISDIRQMSFKHLPLWITATCDFGWFDAAATSAGEEVFLNKNSAGIALFTTSRVVGPSPNSILNNAIIAHLFPKDKTKKPTLGDAFMKAKVSLGTDANKLNFVLLGDPAMPLNYPQGEVLLETISVNGEEKEISEQMNFRALDVVTLTGSIVDDEKNLIESFNGQLLTTVFDGKQSIQSVTVKNGQYWYFDDYQSKVFMGNESVKDGRFTITFTVPLDISYNPDNTGKISLYAYDENNMYDAAGAFLKYTLSGSNGDADYEENGPVIEQMYLNSKSFKSGGTVHETPFFFARVSDDDGINVSGNGLGHDITISIDNNSAWTYNLNNYYQMDNATGGYIGFSIPELPKGEHQLVFKVWDILNNSTTDTLSFKVAAGVKPKIYDVIAYPNPASTSTTFVIEHDRPEANMDVEIRIYDLAGRTIWVNQQSGTNISEVKWSLTNGAGQPVQPGVYIYQAVINAYGGKEAVKSKKIIVLGQ